MPSAYPSASIVVEALGDKIVDGLVAAHDHTKVDRAQYREQHPDWVAASSERGAANWLHDRFFAHLKQELDDVSTAYVHDDGVTREMWVGVNFRIRIKRHSPLGRVTTFPTHTALFFMAQPAATLDLLEVVNLCAGYEWDGDLREPVSPVLSLRDGLDNVIWIHELRASGSAKATTPVLPTVDGPIPPVIEVNDDDAGDVSEPGES